MSVIVNGLIVVLAIIVGFSIKMFFGESVGEPSQDVIDHIVEAYTGIDLDPIFKLDDEQKKP